MDKKAVQSSKSKMLHVTYAKAAAIALAALVLMSFAIGLVNASNNPNGNANAGPASIVIAGNGQSNTLTISKSTTLTVYGNHNNITVTIKNNATLFLILNDEFFPFYNSAGYEWGLSDQCALGNHDIKSDKWDITNQCAEGNRVTVENGKVNMSVSGYNNTVTLKNVTLGNQAVTGALNSVFCVSSCSHPSTMIIMMVGYRNLENLTASSATIGSSCSYLKSDYDQYVWASACSNFGSDVFDRLGRPTACSLAGINNTMTTSGVANTISCVTFGYENKVNSSSIPANTATFKTSLYVGIAGSSNRLNIGASSTSTTPHELYLLTENQYELNEKSGGNLSISGGTISASWSGGTCNGRAFNGSASSLLSSQCAMQVPDGANVSVTVSPSPYYFAPESVICANINITSVRCGSEAAVMKNPFSFIMQNNTGIISVLQPNLLIYSYDQYAGTFNASWQGGSCKSSPLINASGGIVCDANAGAHVTVKTTPASGYYAQITVCLPNGGGCTISNDTTSFTLSSGTSVDVNFYPVPTTSTTVNTTTITTTVSTVTTTIPMPAGTVTELSSSGTTLNVSNVGSEPSAIAIAPDGTVWVVNFGSNNVTELSSSGAFIGTFEVGSEPDDIAIGTNGDVWVTNQGSGTVSELSSTGTVLGTFSVAGNPYGIAVDKNGDVWVVNGGINSTSRSFFDTVTELSGSGAVLGTFPVGEGPEYLSIDPSGDVWVTDYVSGNVTELSSSGAVIGANYSAEGSPWFITAAPNGNIWVTDVGGPGLGNLTELSSSGAILGKFLAGTSPQEVAADSNGDVWVTGGDGFITELSSTGSEIATYPYSGSGPQLIAVASSGNVWIVNSGILVS